MKNLASILAFLVVLLTAAAQNSDSRYAESLDRVLQEISKQYHVELSYAGSKVKGKTLTYAEWRFRPSLEETLIRVLSPFDLTFEKQNDSLYRITDYKYYRTSLEDGVEKLDYLKKLYDNKDEWETRKAELRQCFLEALRISHKPDWPDSKPVIVNKRKYKNYRVENFALEVLPGAYVMGSIYKPVKISGKVPLILSPNGHFSKGRYNKDMQTRAAMLAQMGAIVATYDLFAWGESALQYGDESHRRSLAQTMQVLNSLRILDYLLSMKEADPTRVGITGGSGGGSHTMLMGAIDDRFTVSVPVVMLSCYFYGGCPCESGQPVHLCGGGTNNVEMAAMFAPKPMLIISDGGDWSNHVPEFEYPFVQRIYGFYGKTDNVKNVHLPDEGHDYGISKRLAMYSFMAKHLNLDTSKVKNADGSFDESGVVVEDEKELYVFDNEVEKLPHDALKSFDVLENVANEVLGSHEKSEK
ncbi:alpha/beta hydrolase family protein [Saccharicrinis sp. FJH62]|uniref:alpha/beta hydrolase family protein n=1 Tax=Saccharicrinis sp. FJH62 TaxID=3344657 RepID=UPI0035D4D2F0